MKDKVDEVMGPRVQAEELAVHHVGEGGEGVIKAHNRLCQDLPNPFPGNPPLDKVVLRHIQNVIVLDEVVVPDRQVGGCGDEGEQKTYEKRGVTR